MGHILHAFGSVTITGSSIILIYLVTGTSAFSPLWVEEMRGRDKVMVPAPFAALTLLRAEGIEAAKDRSASPAGPSSPWYYHLSSAHPALKALENAFHLQSTALNTLLL